MEKIMKKHVLVLLALLILSACSGESQASVAGNWKLVSYGDPAGPTVAVPDVQTSIEFKEGQVNGNVGCNGFGGTYEIDGDKITFSDVVSTLMFCEGPVGDQELGTLAVLNGSATYVLDRNTLTLTSSDGTSVVVLARS